MRLSASAPRARLLHILICLSLLAQSLLPVSAGAAAPGTVKSTAPAGRESARREVEGADLPDLDAARSRPRHEPKAVPPVPSTRRRCPPRNPRCDDGGAATPYGTPTPTPTPAHPGRSGGPFSVTSAAAPSFAARQGGGAGGGLTWMDLSPLDIYAGGGYAVSDSPVRLLPPADFGAAPAPEPVAFYQPQSGRVNVALATNGGSATASSTFNQPPNWVYSPAGAIDGNRRGSPLGGGQWSGWNDDAPDNTFPDWLQVNFNGHKTIDEIDLFTQQDNYANPSEPTESMTFSQYGLSGFTVEYRTGSGWAAVPGGTVSGNNKVWRKFTFPPVTTDAIRVRTSESADGYSRVTELEAWGTSARLNLALSSNGGVASASSSFNSPPWVFTPAGVNDGDRRGMNWGSGGGWNDAGPAWNMQSNEVWLEVAFPGPRAVDEVDVFTNQDAYANPAEPTESMTFSQYGLSAYEVQYWTGAGWATVPGGSVSGNDKVWRRFTFPALTTSKVRVLAHASPDGYARLAEVEAYGSGASEAPAGTGLTGEYYDGVNFDTYRLTRADAAVNFDWGWGSPHSSVGADNFSVRWTGTVVPRYTQDYTFFATTDDGVRLWIDGQLVIDRWQDQAPSEAASAPLALEAGRHYAMRMEYYERGAGAAAWLKWSSASQATEVVPQSRLYGCWKGSDQFVRDFFQGVLGRQPSAAELQDRAGGLDQAPGDAQLLAEAQGLGALLFTSVEYAARNRTDQQYVTDLYLGYLQRAPDSGGLTHWTGVVAGCGSDQQCRQVKRAEVRAAFDWSGEFGEKVRNLCGTSAGSPGGGGANYNFTAARLDPVNRTGGGGVDAYSRNFNFQIPLVSLPGRAGLDLGLVLSYNSLVWTKDAGGVTFDADQGFPSPGFRLSFPTIEQRFVNPQLQQAGQPTRYSYLLLTPSGARVELRQVGASNVYESADSSYLQLSEGEMTFSSADGTRLSFVLLNGSYRCHQVKDRNGNYLTVSYYGDGRIWKVTDTLGRVLTFEYDNFQNLTSITQPWTREGVPGVSPAPAPDESHEWVTFGYESLTLQPQFLNLAVIGDQPGTVFPAVRQVGLADGSFYRFSYNGWGQVWKVTRYAADSRGANGQPNESHPLSSTRIDLPGSDLKAAAPQAECPRFKEKRVWVEHGVMGQNAEVVTKYDEWTPDMASCEVTLPDGTTKQVSTYATAADGWKKGLMTKEEIFSGSQSVRTTTYAWEHDEASDASYATNPRVTQTTVSDPPPAEPNQQPNVRATRVTYTTPADFQGESGYTGTLNLKLPKKVEECGDANCSPVLRTTVTDYSVPNLNQYVARRILGLARFQYLYEGTEAAGNLRSKVGYVYDELNDPNDPQNKFIAALPSPASQHDSAVYGQEPQADGQGGDRWRGNANRVRQYAVDQQSGAVGDYVERRAGFNVTGTAAYTKDPSGHKSSTGYADAFYQNVNRTHADPQYRLQTYAYPTSVTDPDGFTAWAWYSYDVGVATKIRGQKPNTTANGTDGPVSNTYFDGAGRAVEATNSVNGAHTEWVYDLSMTLVKTYTTVLDDSLQNEALRHYGATALDGLGRVRGSAGNFPGSETVTPAGNYSAQITHYDESGRAVFQSNPTEMRIADGGWTPAGDDANGGLWRGTTQEYDWKGRPTKIINPDGTDRLFEYGGCGCAGGEVVTVRGELVPIPGTQSQGRRAQKSYSDELGRTRKTEALNWNGSIYSSTTTKYDALDRPVRVRQYPGAALWPEPAGEGGGYQTTTLTYDRHGRLKTQHLPSYDANAVATYEYNDDDTVRSVTDPRGVVTDFTYNGRHLPTRVAYDPKQSGVPDTPDVTFAYDAAGNRASMTDEAGSLTYHYDALSRLDSETRQFGGITHRTYTLAYAYNPAGQLKSMTDPFGNTTGYDRDTAGRVTAVTGSGYPAIPQLAGSVQYASGIKYRAWGAVSGASYGDGRAMTAGYDSRLRVTGFQMPGPITMDKAYQYDADGSLRFANDLVEDIFDRSYSYDHAGRLEEAHTGSQARGGQTDDGPYQQTYAYDPFGHSAVQTNVLWKQVVGGGGGQYQNDRRQGWTYDAAGNLTYDQLRHYVNDAAGRMRSFDSGAQTYAYDGEGGVARVTRQSGGTSVVYNLRSTALGGAVVSQLKPQANGLDVRQEIVYAGGAEVRRDVGVTGEVVTWTHEDPAGTTVQEGGVTSYGGPNATFTNPIVQLDPVRASVGWADPSQFEEPPAPPDETSPETRAYSNPWRPGQGCSDNLIVLPCEQVLNNGRANGTRTYTLRTETVTSFRVTFAGSLSWATDEGEVKAKDGVIVNRMTQHLIPYYSIQPQGTSVMEVARFSGYMQGGAGTSTVVQPQNPVPLTSEEDKKLRSDVDNLLKKCEGFVNKILAKLKQLHPTSPPASASIKDLFGKVKIAYRPRSNWGPSTVAGSIAGNDATVLMGWNSKFIYPRVVVHEVLHLSKGSGSFPWYSDYEVAEAIQQTLYDENPVKNNVADSFNRLKKDDPSNPHSGWIDSRLREKCGDP